MKGFQIIINNDLVISAASDLSMSLFLFPADGFFLIRGTDAKENKLRWQKQPMKVGDNIKIRIKELDSVTTPSEIQPEDRNKLKERYLILREELKKKGLI